MYKGDAKPPESGENPWIEIGVVSDEETNLAALVCIQPGVPYPLPSVQLGTLIGEDRRFSPHVHPEVEWSEGEGNIRNLFGFDAIPESLHKQIADVLRAHLVEGRAGAAEDLGSFELDTTHDLVTRLRMGCLSCS